VRQAVQVFIHCGASTSSLPECNLSDILLYSTYAARRDKCRPQHCSQSSEVFSQHLSAR
jgi:hypothetical protein